MYYSTNQIQPKIANIPEFKSQKVAIIQFFNNLVDNAGLNRVFTHDKQPPYFIEKSDLEKVFSVAKEKFGVDFKFEDFYEGNRALLKLESHDDMKSHIVNTKSDLDDVIALHAENSTYGKKEQVKDEARQVQKEKRMEKLQEEIDARKEIERQEFDRASNLLRDFVNDKVVSIDFEFFMNKKAGTYQVTELGISMTEGGEIKGYHFLIKEHYEKKKNRALQQRFDFGTSQVVSEKQIPALINMAMKDAQYVLFHEQREDYEILNQMGVNIPQEIAVIDTQLSYKRYFRQKGSMPNGEKLEGLLDMFKMEYKNLHNAGNDAYMTLKLLQKMSLVQQHFESNKPEQKKNKMR